MFDDLGLPPVIDLPLPTAAADELRMLSLLVGYESNGVHRLVSFRERVQRLVAGKDRSSLTDSRTVDPSRLDEFGEQWSETNRALARRIEHGDDGAVAQLVARDARYLASPLVIAKILRWQMFAWLHGESTPEQDRDEEFARLGEHAAAALAAVAQAICGVGKGQRQWRRVHRLRAEYDEAVSKLEQLQERVNSGETLTNSDIASALSLDEKTYEEALNEARLHPDRVAETARMILAKRYADARKDAIAKDLEHTEWLSGLADDEE